MREYREVPHVTLLTAPPSIHLYGNRNSRSISQGNKTEIGVRQNLAK